MYADSLNLRRTVQNCPQLTPAIAVSDKQIFGYSTKNSYVTDAAKSTDHKHNTDT
jgi:hypothetical protein